MSQKPSIGRIVHFSSDSTPGCENPLATQAAIITEVGEEGVVGLQVFAPTSISTLRGVPFSEEPVVGSWSWPAREATTAKSVAPVEKPGNDPAGQPILAGRRGGKTAAAATAALKSTPPPAGEPTKTED